MLQTESQQLKDFEARLRSVFVPDEGVDVVEWLQRNVKSIPYSPVSGPFRVVGSPWLAEPLRAAVDPECQLAMMMAPPQSGKSLWLELLTCYFVAVQPAPVLALQDTDSNARDWMVTRLQKLWHECSPVTDRLSSGNFDRNDVVMFNRSTFWCLGAHNIKNLQRRTIKYIIGDECWNWPDGNMREADARTLFYKWMGKRIYASQGGYDGDEFSEKFKTTDMREWTFECPECKTRQAFKYENIVYPDDARTDEGWDYEKIRTGTTLQCEGCKVRFEDTDAVRFELNLSGKYVPTNGNAKKTNIGFHYNALCCRAWGDIAEDCCRAKHAHDHLGNDEPRRIFKQKQLAWWWSDEPEAIVGELKGEDYKLREPWEQTAYLDPDTRQIGSKEQYPNGLPLLIMTVDVQRNGYYVVIRSWSQTGRSRLYHWTFVGTDAELVKLQQQHGIHSAFVGIDCGDQWEMVISLCIQHKWIALRGTHVTDFTHSVLVNNKATQIRRSYSATEMVNHRGGVARVIKFGNLPMKDMLYRLRRNKLHQHSAEAGQEYEEQMHSEYRTKNKQNKPQWVPLSRRANHIWDCEVMQLVFAQVLRLVGYDAAGEDGNS